MSDRIIVVDPGHGGKNTGASTPLGHIVEKDLTLQLAKLVKTNKVRGAQIYTTRDSDETLDFATRRHRCEELKADLVISLHFDSLPAKPTMGGLCVYHPVGSGVERVVGTWILNHAPLPLQGGRVFCVDDDKDWLANTRAVVHAYKSAVLIECGYLSNSRNRQFITGPRGLDMIALSITAGIQRYMQYMGNQ